MSAWESGAGKSMGAVPGEEGKWKGVFHSGEWGVAGSGHGRTGEVDGNGPQWTGDPTWTGSGKESSTVDSGKERSEWAGK